MVRVVGHRAVGERADAGRVRRTLGRVRSRFGRTQMRSEVTSSQPSLPTRIGPAIGFVKPSVVDWLRTTPDALHREVEGTLVFVDISGFTALTERLARKGKIGAELMRDTLDGVFTALLDEAYDWGAGLLKWGGDALLLLFDGPDHERARLPRGLGDAADDRPGRPAPRHRRHDHRCGCRSGSATGTFHFFMTGSVHRELLVAGPGDDRDPDDGGDRRRRRDRHQPRAGRAASIRRASGRAKDAALLLVGAARGRARARAGRRRRQRCSTSRRASRSRRAPTCCSSGASPSTGRSRPRSST